VSVSWAQASSHRSVCRSSASARHQAVHPTRPPPSPGASPQPPQPPASTGASRGAAQASTAVSSAAATACLGHVPAATEAAIFLAAAEAVWVVSRLFWCVMGARNSEACAGARSSP
jgi:hypothetical protein